MSSRTRWLLTALLIAVLALGACGRGGNDAPAAEEAAPLAAEEAPLAAEAEPTEAAEEEAVAEEAAAEPTEAAEEEAVAEEAAEEAPAEEAATDGFDAVTVVDEYLSNIPDGFMAVGAIDAFKEILDTGEAVLIDVREEGEYSEGHIPGAVNIPIRTLAQNLDKIPTDKPVMVYCASGHRAGMATSALRTLGYDNVRAYPPGWKGWTAAEEEISTEAMEGDTYEMPEIDPALVATVDGFLSTIPDGFLSLGTAEKLQDALDNGAVLIDVREESEYADGAIPGAINIPIRTLAQNLDQIPTDAPVVVYCASGFRAALSTAALQEMGYTNVRSFPPGYGGWEAAQGESGDVPAEVEAAVESDMDIVAQVDAYLSSIPDGFMSVGSLDNFKNMLENTDVYVVDVREESEYTEGHVPGAVNIPIRTLADNLDMIPADQPVVVYCASGHRAGMATTALRELGYDNVKAFPAGWKGWSAAEEEVSTEATEAGTFEMADVNPEMLAATAEFLNNIPDGFYSLGTIETLEGALDAGATLIDVREENEFAEGSIPGAINIPIRTLAQNLDQIPTDAPVVVYCASGFRAALSTAALQSMGYTNVRSFPPGYGAWEAAQ